jgi:hypothetical protein
VFRFHDGSKQTAVDPIAVFRKLQGYPGLNLVADLKALELFQSQLTKLEKDDDKPESELQKKIKANGLESWDRLLAATRSAFGVREFHVDAEGKDAGMTDAEVMNLFMSFWAYLDSVKKNTSPTPTSQDSTAPTS